MVVSLVELVTLGLLSGWVGCIICWVGDVVSCIGRGDMSRATVWLVIVRVSFSLSGQGLLCFGVSEFRGVLSYIDIR